MNVYNKKQEWKLILLIVAIIIGAASLWYTNDLVKSLSREERKKVELWAEGTKQLANINENANQDFSFIFEVIKNNETVPVILTDEKDNIISARNLDSLKANDEVYLQKQLETMKLNHEPIVIELVDGHRNFIYYKDSTILSQLSYYPFIQLGVIFLFIFVSYLAFSSSRKAEQNQVWVGMSKETAHQLGTPISSLMAWVEILKQKKEISPEMILEVQKDIKRLETITERFSKIGSTPILLPTDIIEVLNNSVNYIRTRSSNRVSITVNQQNQDKIFVPVNVALFEWVIENLCKNAIDAMGGNGSIAISIIDSTQVLYIDIKDTGKGISKSKYKTVFQPGYTTKKRGWGLGLSLSKRIIESYHEGKIFVKNSEVNNGTTFRIMLKKKQKS